MIGKVVKTKDGAAGSFFGLNNYILSGDEKIEYTGCVNTLVNDPKLCAVEMTSVVAQSRATKPVLHTLLSWPAGEHPTPEQCDEAAQIVLHELGLDGHECVYALHKNTDDYHIHFSINKVNPETFRSVDPNRGYTEKAMERAARWVEYRQNWKVEENNWSVITAEGELIKNPDYKKKKEDKRIDQKVVDKENRYAEKSAVRIGQEQVKELIINAKSWDELHKSLGEAGCRYQKKGSGAIVFIGDTAIKASSIAKACGLNKLEKKLGAFIDPPQATQEKLEPVHKSEPLAEFVEAAKKTPDKMSNWKQYLIDKKEFYKERKKDREQQKQQYNQKYRELKAAQKAERQELAAQSWKGRGKEYNVKRSILAAAHAGEMSELAEERKRARRELSKKYGQRFPSYEEWNKFFEREQEAQEWRFRRPRVNEITKEDNLYVEPKVEDIRVFTAEADPRTGFVAYKNKSTQRAAFIDKGKSIRVNDMCEEAILASLQLGAAKWGAVKISGTNDYIDKCIEIAVKNNIKISNPELQERIEKAEKQATPAYDANLWHKIAQYIDEYESDLTKSTFNECPTGHETIRSEIKPAPDQYWHKAENNHSKLWRGVYITDREYKTKFEPWLEKHKKWKAQKEAEAAKLAAVKEAALKKEIQKQIEAADARIAAKPWRSNGRTIESVREARVRSNMSYQGAIIEILADKRIVQRWEDNGKVHGIRIHCPEDIENSEKLKVGDVVKISYSNDISKKASVKNLLPELELQAGKKNKGDFGLGE